MSKSPDAMRQRALQAQKLTRKHFVVELDFSQPTMGQFDELRTTMAYALRGGRSPENVRQWSALWGAYLGEVLRAETGAAWVETPAAATGAGESPPTVAASWTLVRGARRVSPEELVGRWLEGESAEKFVDIYQRAHAALRE